MYQAIRENDISTITDLYGSGDYPDLAKPDDVGNYPAFLAIFFDRPQVLRLLHDKGVDLARKCDDTSYGTPAFYAMHYGKTELLSDLWKMGYDLTDPCDKYGMPPSYYADKKGDKIMTDHLKELTSRGTLQDVMATIIQRCTRGLAGRNEYRAMVKERDRAIMAQTEIGKVWRGGVVRMRDNKRRRELEEKKAAGLLPEEGKAVEEEKEGKAEVEEEGGKAVEEEEGTVAKEVKVDDEEGKVEEDVKKETAVAEDEAKDGVGNEAETEDAEGQEE
jgi:hypothetical protein